MKFHLTRKIWTMSKFFLYIAILQAVFSTMVIANTGNAQALDKVQVSLQLNNSKLENAFKIIQDQTDYFFTYDFRLIKEITVSSSRKNLNLGDFLMYVSGESGLSFSIFEHNIFVKRESVTSNSSPEYKIKIEIPTSDTISLSRLSTKGVVIYRTSIADKIIQGRVTDSAGNPLIGATIIVKSNSQGTVTDENGMFSLGIPVEESDIIITVSYIGYSSREFKISSNETKLDIVLLEDATELNEVVVVGYGVQKKINATGAVTQVAGELINQRPITQASQALQGLAAGVFVNTQSGEPGNDKASITIRGIGTLNDTDPLVLIDGIEAPINSLNPNDIETINILKDAASASIYGTRAANGVILITTKRGAEGKTSVSYDGYYGVSTPTVLPDMVWDNRLYLESYRTAADNVGRSHILTDDLIDLYANRPSTNWTDEVIDQGSIQNHNLAIAGGNDKLSFRWSNGFLDQQHYFKGDYFFKRYSSRLNLDVKLSERLKIGTSFAYVNSDGRQTPKDGGLSFDNSGRDEAFSIFKSKGDLLFTHTISNNPHVVTTDELGRYGGMESGTGRSSRFNPIGIIDNMFVTVDGNDFLGSGFAEYEVTQGLKVRGTLGVNYQQQRTVDTRLEFRQFDRLGNQTNIINNGGDLLVRENNSINLTGWLQATYEKTFGQHDLRILAGINRETNETRQAAILEENFGARNLVRLGNGANVRSSNFDGAWTLASQFGRVNYSFANKYLLEANIRRDGSSRFGSNNRWAIFPGVSAGYIISNEDFWKINFIDFFKVRGSWGKLGVQSQNLYPFASQFSLGFDYAGNSGGGLVVAGNPNLQWEEATTTDLGIDLRMFDSRVTIEVDYYVKRTENILSDLPTPLTAGVVAPLSVNSATLENRGWDLGLKLRHNFGDLRLSAGLNLTNVKNKIIALNPDLTDGEDRIQIDGADNVWWIRGESINAIFAHEFGGIFQIADFNEDGTLKAGIPDHSFIGSPAPGDVRYVDQNQDGLIDETDRVVVGNRNPEWIYGFNFTADYKGFDFNVLFQGIGDADVYISRGYGPFAFAGLRRHWVDNQWTPENTNTNVPRLFVDRNGFNGQTIEGNGKTAQNALWVQNRAYLRLKNIQLGYTLPSKLFDNNPIGSLRIYISGQNLLTSTDLLGLDPDREATETYATAVAPNAQTIIFGINAKF